MSNYNKAPLIRVSDSTSECLAGWDEIARALATEIARRGPVVCVECYPGVFVEEIIHALRSRVSGTEIIVAERYLKPGAELDSLLSRDLTNDPVFGRLTGLQLSDFFSARDLELARDAVSRSTGEHIFVIGSGAALIAPQADLLVYADLARWEIQQRQRRGEIGNLGASNSGTSPAALYKRSFFVDWRVADRLKKILLPRIDSFLDTNHPDEPKLISRAAFRSALEVAASRPFRLVPFFDPGPWGGQWMRKVCDLPEGPPNYAWCFDCVPEENSLLLSFGDRFVEIPAIDLVFLHPRELLGDAVHARFGTEFPIRFDFLDTMDGGNLSLQVHPLTEYIQENFGMHYTQDESYYLLDAGQDACVYLGLKEEINPQEMITELRAAQDDGACFAAERFVNQWPARKHDHFLIPAGTVHCSGRNSMVLEISATPYIFTFKMWDWNRLGLDGRPRPIHLAHGIANIQWDRTTGWVERELVNTVERVAQGDGWHEERTGLHEREFIETRRHWFTKAVPHHTDGGVNVLNLVEGAEAIVESPTRAFLPFHVHYAETFIVPASVGAYTVRPAHSNANVHATIKAFVRTRP